MKLSRPLRSLKTSRPRAWNIRLNAIIAILLVCIGVYILLITFSPFIQSLFVNPRDNPTTKLLDRTSSADVSENRLYIPKIDINLTYATGGAEVMESGAWWRRPENGNPRDGGNFVLSAHRFIMGLTPEQTLRKSPFYTIDRLQLGDEIVVDYDGVRYTYVIREISRVKPEAVEIEKRTDQPQLTLYSCTLGGASDGREVIIAAPKV